MTAAEDGPYLIAFRDGNAAEVEELALTGFDQVLRLLERPSGSVHARVRRLQAIDRE
jgi:hypothetical protein